MGFFKMNKKKQNVIVIQNKTDLSNIDFTEPQFMKQREGRMKRDNSDKISVRALLDDYKKLEKRNLSTRKERGARQVEVKINREIREYTESIFFGLSMRQFIFSALACGIAVLLYFVLKPYFRY